LNKYYQFVWAFVKKERTKPSNLFLDNNGGSSGLLSFLICFTLPVAIFVFYLLNREAKFWCRQPSCSTPGTIVLVPGAILQHARYYSSGAGSHLAARQVL
jgi:hypothetical protein